MSIKKIKSELLLTNKEKVIKLENALISIADEENIVTQQDTKIFPLKHSFADGVYVRQMNMEKGSSVIGAIHNHAHVWFLLTGNISVAAGDVIEEYVSPCYVIASPGTKRIIHANEDSIFVNVHKNPSNTQSIQELENEIVSINYKEYEEYINKKK